MTVTYNQPTCTTRFHISKWLLVFAFIIITMTSGCSTENGSDTATVQPVEELNKRVVRKLFMEGFSGGDLKVIEEVMSPDIELHDPNLPPGIEGVKAIVRKNNEAFDDWTFTMDDVIAVKDKVVIRWAATGIHAGSFKGETPTGKEVRLHGIAIYRLQDGVIVEDWVVPDNLQFLMQLGVIPPFGMSDENTPGSNDDN